MRNKFVILAFEASTTYVLRCCMQILCTALVSEATGITSDFLHVVNVHHALLFGPFLLVQIDRSLSENLCFRRLAVKNFGDLLKGAAFGLREEEIDGGNHRCKRADVDEVEFPGDGFECDGVAELVENYHDELAYDREDSDTGVALTSGSEDSGQVDREALGSEGEGKNLDWIGDRQGRECDVVEGEENEQEGNCSTSGSLDGMLCESGAERGDNDERCQHATSRKEPERAATEAFCTHSSSESEEGVPHLECKIDAGLCDRADNANALENRRKVVGDCITVSMVFRVHRAELFRLAFLPIPLPAH